jgi:nucleotide-binding universal stress UspA family protein
MVFARRRYDPQPTAQAAVLLATTGEPFSKAAIRRAHELAAGEPVAVLFILKVYGSQFVLPNPGLLPTRKERDQGLAVVQRAITSLERQGATADGQIAATRSAGRTVAKVARARKVRHVVMDEPEQSGMGRVIQGSVVATVRRGLRGGADLELVDARPSAAR